MKELFVVAGSIKQDGRMVRGAGLVEVEGETEFDRELNALRMLPDEAIWQRGKHRAEVWPLESPEGTQLALRAGLVKSTPEINGGGEDE